MMESSPAPPSARSIVDATSAEIRMALGVCGLNVSQQRVIVEGEGVRSLNDLAFLQPSDANNMVARQASPSSSFGDVRIGYVPMLKMRALIQWCRDRHQAGQSLEARSFTEAVLREYSNRERNRNDTSTTREGRGGGGYMMPPPPPPARSATAAAPGSSASASSSLAAMAPPPPPVASMMPPPLPPPRTGNDNNINNKSTRPLQSTTNRTTSYNRSRLGSNQLFGEYNYRRDQRNDNRGSSTRISLNPNDHLFFPYSYRRYQISSSNDDRNKRSQWGAQLQKGSDEGRKRLRWEPPPPSKIKQEKGNGSTNVGKPSVSPKIKEEKDNDGGIVAGRPLSMIKREKDNSSSKVGIDEKSKPETHMIFTIDFSSSMKTSDVLEGTKLINRWDAVFACMKMSLEEQQNKNTGDVFVVSLIIFNMTAETLLERMPLIGQGEKVFKALKTAQKAYKPHGGTGFSAGLERTKLVARMSPMGSNIVVIFLSDGRPGDLNPSPPKTATDPMQTTFRHKKKAYPAAGTHIEQMKQRHGNNFSFQVVCIYEEGRHWLEYLANRFDGSFHKPNLSLEDGSTQNVATQGSAAIGAKFDDESIQFLNVKSQSTLLRERYKQARAAGNVHSIAGTNTTGGTSMRDTFHSISSTVTDIRNASSKSKVERQVVLEGSRKSRMVSFQATRMVLDSESGKISMANGEKSNGRLVKIAKQPFAQGGLRNVYRMCEIQVGVMKNLVCKESRHEVPYQERLKFHIETSSCQTQAQNVADQFNTAVAASAALRGRVAQIKVLRAEVYRLADEQSPGGFRYLAVEDHIQGQYQKWNNNAGFTHPAARSPPCQVAQAFSHFSYEHSQQKEMVVDIQGSDYTYTDPQLHSKDKKFGRADRGASGFNAFFSTHKCNFICHGLCLTDRSAGVL